MEIPRKVRVGNRWYSVEVVEMMKEKRRMAYVDYIKAAITIGTRSNITGRRFSQDDVEENFWHELVHAILNDMKHPLRDNERFVTMFARRLARAVKSAKLPHD